MKTINNWHIANLTVSYLFGDITDSENVAYFRRQSDRLVYVDLENKLAITEYDVYTLGEVDSVWIATQSADLNNNLI